MSEWDDLVRQETIKERALEVVQERRAWLFNSLEPSVVPGIHELELNVGEPALEILPQEAAELFAVLVR